MQYLKCPVCELDFSFAGRANPEEAKDLCPLCNLRTQGEVHVEAKEEAGGISITLTAAGIQQRSLIPLTETPSYYRFVLLNRGDGSACEFDVGDLLDALKLGYWKSSALGRIIRAGKKEGETPQSAIRNAIQCLRRELQRLDLEEGREP